MSECALASVYCYNVMYVAYTHSTYTQHIYNSVAVKISKLHVMSSLFCTVKLLFCFIQNSGNEYMNNTRCNIINTTSRVKQDIHNRLVFKCFLYSCPT